MDGTVGLHISPHKGDILLRDPNKSTEVHSTSIRVGRYDMMNRRYLEVYLTNDLNRPMVLRKRIKTAFNVTLLSFLKSNGLSIPKYSTIGDKWCILYREYYTIFVNISVKCSHGIYERSLTLCYL